MGQGNKKINRSWMKKKPDLEKTRNRPLTKKEEKTYQASLKKGKTYTKAQLRFKEREAKGLSGLTGGKKGETVAEYRARQKRRVQKAAEERNKKFKNKNVLKKNTTTSKTTGGGQGNKKRVRSWMKKK